MTKERSFWFLVSGEVLYKEPEKEKDYIQSVRLNGIIKGKEKTIPVTGIAKAQEVLQINFKKLISQQAEIVGVTLYAISNLGFMTDEEFNNLPVEKESK
ncbi:hypothetical protein [uncultured Methanosphaera sp.]|jgi:hypothetical protein|uniref:hypothetical protein n=1 Tax=uncultured Methanosphaera sp. TaxID=262501 RepID=UPI002594EE20|nr:hypothetical protein [uncultured Methanosphaera sp.]